MLEYYLSLGKNRNLLLAIFPFALDKFSFGGAPVSGVGDDHLAVDRNEIGALTNPDVGYGQAGKE